ncbi:MAG: aldo/keto reductase [Oscillospiraceae bacterium]|nr:aldo/keto reductase [Oscillospiraceae bacterium]
MEYRQLGATGLQAGVIGLGCENLDGKPYDQVKDTIDAAIDSGINIFDVFMPGKEIREHIAAAIGTRRGKVMIQGHLGSVDLNQKYDISRDLSVVKKYFEDLLRIFGGYIDLGMLFFMDSEADYKGVFETGFADYAKSLKEKGDIGHIGFSSHNPEMAKRVIETGLPEIMMFSINPAYDMLPPDQYILKQLENGFMPELFRGIDPKRAELYKLCEQRGIGVTVMKTLGAGKLISAEHTPFQEPLTVTQCIHYALTRPAVTSVMVGCQTREEVLDCVGYLNASKQERDYSRAINTPMNDFRGNCVYCSHCQPCASNIDIAAVNRYLDIARLDESNVPPSIRSHYSSLEHGGSECSKCGECESRCPFGVKIKQNMAEAAEIFGR